MRTVATAVMWLVATLALTVAIGAGWTAWNVQREDGFVDLAATLGNDADVQQSAATLAGQTFADQPSVPSVLQDPAARLVTASILRLVDSAGWDDAWRETARRTHQDLFSSAAPQEVRVDLAPLIQLSLDEVTSDLPVELSTPESLPVTVSEEDPQAGVRAVSRAGAVAVVAAGAAAIAALLALATSRRRSTTIASLGVGALLAAGFWWLLGNRALPEVISRQQSTGTDATELMRALAGRMTSSLDGVTLWVAVAGAVLVAGGGLVRLVRR